MQTTIYKGQQVPEAKGLCVIIDVLRAFTTAAFAFHHGAKEIHFVSSHEEALARHQNDPDLVLMGEIGGRTIEGFHYGNSPSEIASVNLLGKTMVQRTSSGTQGVIGCQHASHILVSSFVIAEATLKRILQLNPSHVSFIVTGKNNGDEDLALAEYLQSRLEGRAFDLESALERVRKCPGAQRMISGEISYPDGALDLTLATDVDRFSFAIEVAKQGNELIGRHIHC